MNRPNARFWVGRRILVTGHTGFKGGWLCHWLHSLGAQVHGYALSAPTTPSLFAASALGTVLDSQIGDIRERAMLHACLQRVQPELVLHLAAQPLVRQSYRDPFETYSTNVMGLVNLLDGVRECTAVRAVLNVTTDKCYDNKEWLWGYRENEALGGHDPYSSSKACAELVSAAYRQSYFSDGRVALATARAGNVIGGGDWAADRLIPDLLRAFDAGEELRIRYPSAIRPWQHVLEPLCGYLLLAEKLLSEGQGFAEAWNFGPADSDAKPVSWIVEAASRLWQHGDCVPRWVAEPDLQPHEAGVLKLDSGKARARLGWQPRWSLEQALAHILDWHHAWRSGQDMRAFTHAQIHAYQSH